MAICDRIMPSNKYTSAKVAWSTASAVAVKVLTAVKLLQMTDESWTGVDSWEGIKTAIEQPPLTHFELNQWWWYRNSIRPFKMLLAIFMAM